MIPVRLTFEAFGPFPKKQTIDFTKFDDNRIFLITGPTGSGKTTIFDAITFSLFGNSSGSTRNRNTLKSDFVGDSALCYTEFTFRIHGAEYTVRRIPAQTCPNARGTGTKVQTADAELRDESNTVLCSRVKEVDKKIEELLGLNYEQFRKIVLLPQGEFRRFLSDSSEAKQEILRHIFSTELLGRFTEQLKARVSSLQAEYQHTLSQCSAYLETIQPEEESTLASLLDAEQPDVDAILTALAEQNAEQEKQYAQNEALLNEARKRADAINPELARQENDLIEQYHRTDAEFAEMNRHNEEWAKYAAQIRRLEKIAPLAQKDSEIQKLENALTSLRLKQEQNLAQKEKLDTAFAEANRAFDTAKAQAKAAHTAAGEIPALNTLLNELNTLAQAKSELETVEARIRKYERQLKILAEAKLRLLEKNLLTQLEEAIKQREMFFERIPDYHTAAQKAADASAATAHALAGYIAAQAPFMAQNLRENEPCPVCGALTHPAPAKACDHAASKELYDRARADETKAIRRRDLLLEELKALLSEENRGADPFTCLESENAILQKLRTEQQQREKTFHMFRIPDVLLNDTMEDLEKRLQDHNALHQNACGKLDMLKAQVETLKQTVPQDADVQTVSAKITVLEKAEKDTSEALKETQNTLTSTQNRVIRIETILNETDQQFTDTDEQLTACRAEFETMLIQSECDRTEFEQLALLLPNLTAMQEELHNHRLEYRAKRDLVQKLKEQTASMQQHDLDAILAAKKAAQDECSQLQASLNAADRVLHANKQAETHLRDQSRKEKAQRERYEQAHFLYSVARGDYSGKVNFERYVLAHYFENVIRNANIRLEQMTNSRYTLIRRTVAEGHNRTSGLEMDVFDSYTGLSRHVDTLSGGESFKVALALALGLADIISESSGGIELNTMLIDEGFGSLDSDSLDAAITCLHDLQADGRYIGIISHVAELRERIPQRIVIKPSVSGSTILEGSL